MAYSGSQLLCLLKSLGIKRVVMRYYGEEGNASVTNVNFLHEEGKFLSYQEIMTARMPENEFYAMGLEILARCKADWADDWGGKGELTWNLDRDVEIDHHDRRVDEVTLELSIPERDLRKTIDHSDLPATEVSGLTTLGCKAIYHGDADPVLGQYFGSKYHEEYAFSRKLLDSATPVFLAASTLALSHIIEGDPAEGVLLWTMGDKVDVSITSEVERFFHMPLSVPVTDILDMTV